MEIVDPKPFLDAIDQGSLQEMLRRRPSTTAKTSALKQGKSVVYVEPSCQRNETTQWTVAIETLDGKASTPNASLEDDRSDSQSDTTPSPTSIRRGKVQRLGDFIDTDAVGSTACPFHVFTTSCISRADALIACARRNSHLVQDQC